MGILGENVVTLKQIDFSLRFLVIPLSIASIWLTVTNQQDSIIYGSTIGFNNLKGLKYTVWISAISGGYALLAALSSWVKFLVNKAWIFFVSDQVVAYLMVTSGAAMGEIIYLAYKGDATVTWSEACTTYGRFCSRLKLVLAVHAIALLCFLLLALISAYRAFSCFDPPSLPSASKDDLEHEEMS